MLLCRGGLSVALSLGRGLTPAVCGAVGGGAGQGVGEGAVWSRRLFSSDADAPLSFALRDEFTLPPSFDFRTWFPLHMSVQLKKMEGKLRSVDLVVEVVDARVPITGRNPVLKQMSIVRPHILVINKMDLIKMNRHRSAIEEYYREQGVNYLVWTDCKRRLGKALQDLRNCMVEALRSEPRYNRTVKTEYQVMVVGIPNVGKSSLINSLRSSNLGIKHSAVQEGARPGVTVRVQNRVRVLDRPPIYVLDTPGVLAPRQSGGCGAMRLALCNLVLESATSLRHVADYLLFWMNRTGDTSYVQLLGLKEPSDDIDKVLLQVARVNDLRVRLMVGKEGYQERWDVDAAARSLIALFRNHQLRDHCLDKEELLPYM